MTCRGRFLMLFFFLIASLPSSALAKDRCSTDGEMTLIQRVQITGSTIEDTTLSHAYAEQIGKPDTPDARREIAKAIAAAYSLSDIALFDVSPGPPRDCGVVDIAITEGRIGRAIIRGRLRASAKRLINRYITQLIADRPLHVSTLQWYVSLIREVGGVRSKVAFEPTAEHGVVQMVITASQSRARLGVSIDNRGASIVGGIQIQASGSLYGVLGGGDALDATVFATQYPKRLFGISGSYSVPLGSDGTRFSVSATRSRSDLAEYHYRSSVTAWGVSVYRPVVKSYSANAYIGVDLKRTTSHVEFYGYDLLSGQGWSIGPSASYGAISTKGEFAASVGTEIGYARRSSKLVYLSPARKTRRITVQAAALRKLGPKLAVRLKGVAQVGTANLPATEQMGLGGSEFGRAFDSGSFSGDSGIAGSGEIAFRLGKGNDKAERRSEVYAFVDAGKLSYHDPLSSVRDPQTLMSSGAGIRIAPSARISLSLEVAAGIAHIFAERKYYRRLSIGIQHLIF